MAERVTGLLSRAITSARRRGSWRRTMTCRPALRPSRSATSVSRKAARTACIASRHSSISVRNDVFRPKTKRLPASKGRRASTWTVCCELRDACRPTSARGPVRRRQLCLIDLFPSGADRGCRQNWSRSHARAVVSWRTGGVTNHPGNIAWDVHYRFDAQVLRGYPHLSEDARQRVRELSRHLDFNYDPLASSLLVVDVDGDVLAA